MRGPMDDIAGEPMSPPVSKATVVETRPPGGKALLRLLHFLLRRGYTEAADLLIDNAAPVAGQKLLRAKVATVLPAPAQKRGERPPESAARRDLTNAAAPAAESLIPVPLPIYLGPTWRSLGPTTIPNGQTYGASRVNVSGRVASIAVDPHNPAHVLCGSAGGGVWESQDRGASWAPRSDNAASLAVGAVVFDPVTSGVAYCGTGEGNFYWTLGAGLLKSTNGGTSWSMLCTNPFVGQGFYDIKIDPANNQHMLSANTYGVYVSTDGGATWVQRRNVVSAWSLSIAPGGGTSAEILAGCKDGVWRSTDGGVTWSAVSLPGAATSYDRVAVAHAPNNAGVVYVFAASGNKVYYWRRAAAGGSYTAFTGSTGLGTGQAWYDWFLAVAPDNANQIYVGGIDSWRGDLSGTTWTWTAMSDKGSSGSSIHPDQHAIAFEPGNPAMLYIGCDGGLFRSGDRGITFASCNNGLVITEFEYIAQNVGSSRWLIGGTQDNGTQRYTGDSAWTHVMDGDGGDCAVNHDNPSIVFAEFYNISPQRSTSGGDWATFSGLSPGVPANESSLFYCPYTCCYGSGNTVALGTVALYISRDNGATWTRLVFPTSSTCSAISIPDANHVYAATTDGRVYHTTWTGSAWPALTALTTPRSGAYASALYVNPTNLLLMVLTSSSTGGGRVFVSTDGGSSWADRTAGLPNQPVNSVEVDPRNTNRIWVGTDLGVYQSLNQGAAWSNFSYGLPNVLVGDLVFHPHAWVLRAGTRNRGVWEIPVDGWMTAPVSGLQFTGTINANQTGNWYTFNWPATWHMLWTVMPTSVSAAGAQITWKVEVQRASNEFLTYWIQVQNLTNVPVAFEGRYCILSRY